MSRVTAEEPSALAAPLLLQEWRYDHHHYAPLQFVLYFCGADLHRLVREGDAVASVSAMGPSGNGAQPGLSPVMGEALKQPTSTQ